MSSGIPITPAVLAEVLDGGQAFRWYRAPDGACQGVWAGCMARLKLSGRNALLWSAPQSLATEIAHELPWYLAADTDFVELADRLPWRSDTHLARCIEAFPGLRLLRQPLGETLLCFLCSAAKRIVQIKQMAELLAQRHGAPLLSKAGAPEANRMALQSPPVSKRLPVWEELAVVPEKDLRLCRLGFRAHYISATARFLACRPGWLEEVERLPYEKARARLCELPGVGEKVADCVLLYGAGRLEAFPVDAWILKAMAARYGLASWKPSQVAHFGRVHFGPLAGLAQQYLFAWERRHGGRNAA